MNKTTIPIATASLLAMAIFLASIAPIHAQTGDFTITSTPLEICVTPGGVAYYATTVSSVDGFQGSVNLATSVDPSIAAGPTASAPDTESLTAGQSVSFYVTVSTVAATPTRTYTITVIGGSDVSTHSATVYLAVEPVCGALGGTTASVNAIGLLTPFATIAAIVAGAAAGSIALAYKRFRLQ
jgi:hypothetical protein